MEVTRIISKQECHNFDKIIENLYEITKQQRDINKKLIDFLAPFIIKKNNHIIIKSNVDFMEKLIKDSSNKQMFKICLEYCFNDKKSSLTEIYNAYISLSQVVNVHEIKNVDDIITVLLQCYSLRKSVFLSSLIRQLADNYIMVIINLILNEKDILNKGINNINFMCEALGRMLKGIEKQSMIYIDDEIRFYNLLNKYYYACDFNEEIYQNTNSEDYDLVRLIKSFVKNHNDGLTNNDDKMDLCINKLLRYLLNTSIENLDYNEFPHYDNPNFLLFIKQVRKKLIEKGKNDPHFPERLAILDCYYMSYYKYKNNNDSNTSYKLSKN